MSPQPPSRSPSPSYAAVVAGATPVPRRLSARLATNTTSPDAHPPNTNPSLHTIPPPPLSPTIPAPRQAVELGPINPVPQPSLSDVSHPLHERQPREVPTTRKPKGKGKQNLPPQQLSPTTPVASSSRTRQPQLARQQVADVQADMSTHAATLASLEKTVRAHRVAALRDLEMLSARLNDKVPAPPVDETAWAAPFESLTQRLEEVETVLRSDLVDTDRDLSRRIAATEDRLLVLERRGEVPQVRTRAQPPSPIPQDSLSRSRSTSHTQRSTTRSPSPSSPPRPSQHLPPPTHAKRSRSPGHDDSSKPVKKSRSAKHHSQRATTHPTPLSRSQLPSYTAPPRVPSLPPTMHAPPPSAPPPFNPILHSQQPPPHTASTPSAPTHNHNHDTLAPAEASYLRLYGVRLTAHDTDIWSGDRARNHRVFRDIVLHLPHQQPPIPDPNRNTHISTRVSDFFFQSPDDLVAFLLAWEARPADLYNISASRIPSSLLGDIVARDPPAPGSSRRPNPGNRGRGGFWQGQGGRSYDTAPY